MLDLPNRFIHAGSSVAWGVMGSGPPLSLGVQNGLLAELLQTRSIAGPEVLWGEEDQWIPISRGRALAGKLTRGALTPVPGSGHLMQEDAPEAIIAAMFSASQRIET